MSCIFAVILALGLFPTSLVAEDNSPNRFLYPSGDDLVDQGSEVLLRWTTEWGPEALISLGAFQYDGAGDWIAKQLLDHFEDPGSYLWEAQPLANNIEISNKIHFSVWLGGWHSHDPWNETNSFNGGHLIIKPKKSVTSLSETAATTSSSSSRSTPTAETRLQPEVTPSSPTPGGSGEQNKCCDAGHIGGIVAGGCGVISTFLAYLGFRKNKRGERAIPVYVGRISRSASRQWRHRSNRDQGPVDHNTHTPLRSISEDHVYDYNSDDSSRQGTIR